MKILKYNIFTLLAAVLFMGVSTVAYAQSQTEAVEVYNKAIDLAAAGKYQQAIDTYSQAISIAKELGAEGQDIVERSQDALPRLYYQSALNIYKNFQQSPSIAGIEKAIDAFKTAADKASQYGNSDIANQAKGVITQLYYQKSVLAYQQGNLSAALAAINTAIERNPDYAKAYYQKGLIIKDQESATLDEYLAAVEKTVEVANKVGNASIARQAKESASAVLVYRGAQRVQGENYSGAIVILEKALEFNPESVNAYYRLAQAYNAQGNWNQALEYAQKALQYANGGAASKAKIYYAIGNAYKGLGQYDNACEAYSNADYGRFSQSVQHTMEFVLKCEE